MSNWVCDEAGVFFVLGYQLSPVQPFPRNQDIHTLEETTRTLTQGSFHPHRHLLRPRQGAERSERRAEQASVASAVVPIKRLRDFVRGGR